MKGVLLAGGYGTRLRPLTYITNKHLLPIYDKPMIEYPIMALQQVGITDICVIVGGSKPEDVIKYLGDGYKYGVNLHYEWQGEPKGIADGILCSKSFIKDDSFIVHLADNIFPEGIAYLTKGFVDSIEDVRVILHPVKDPTKFGIVELENNKIVRFVEKPIDPQSNLCVTGLYCLRPNIFKIIKKLRPSWRGELEITEAFDTMVKKEYNIKYKLVKGKWFDVGSFDRMLEASNYMRKKMRGR